MYKRRYRVLCRLSGDDADLEARSSRRPCEPRADDTFSVWASAPTAKKMPHALVLVFWLLVPG